MFSYFYLFEQQPQVSGCAGPANITGQVGLGFNKPAERPYAASAQEEAMTIPIVYTLGSQETLPNDRRLTDCLLHSGLMAIKHFSSRWIDKAFQLVSTEYLGAFRMSVEDGIARQASAEQAPSGDKPPISPVTSSLPNGDGGNHRTCFSADRTCFVITATGRT